MSPQDIRQSLLIVLHGGRKSSSPVGSAPKLCLGAPMLTVTVVFFGCAAKSGKQLYVPRRSAAMFPCVKQQS